MILKELTSEEFNAFTNNNNCSIYQSSNYAHVMNKQKFDCLYYGIIDDNKIYGASLILINKIHGFKYAYAPRGFICDYSNKILLRDFTNLLKKELSKKNVVAIRINPLIIRSIYKDKKTIPNNNFDHLYQNLIDVGFVHLGYNNYFEGIKPRFEAIVPLDKNRVNVFNHISKSFKTKIRSADYNGIKIFKGDSTNLQNLFLQTQNKYPRDLKYFEDVYYYFKNNNEVELFYSVLDTSQYVANVQYKYQKQTQLCNKANALVFKNVKKNNQKFINDKLREENKLDKIKKELIYATKLLKNNPQGIITSSALIIKNKSEIYLMMDGYDKTYKRLNSKHLLLWKLMEKYSLEGFKTFNLGGIGNYNLKENKYNGLTNFKLNFGALIYEYIGDLELVTNKPLYIMYKNSSSVMKILKK